MNPAVRLPAWAVGVLTPLVGFAVALLLATDITSTVIRHETAELLGELAPVFGLGVPLVRSRVRKAHEDGARFGEAATYAKAVATPPRKAPAKKAAPRRRQPGE